MPTPSVYVQPADYATYGIAETVTADMVGQATSLINAFLARPGGLLYSVDFAGNPAYMAGKTTSFVLLAGSGGVPSGQNVVVPYSGPTLDNNSVGEVVIIDRTNEDLCEACVISAVGTNPNTVTLYNVQNVHGDGARMELGLTLSEQKEMPKDRSTTLLANLPVMNLQSGVGRYGYGRRSQQISGSFQEMNLLAVVSSFGGPPLWIPWTVTDAGLNRNTGEVWVPAGILLAYYTEVKIWYTSGYSYATLPDQVKFACANVVKALKETGLGPNIKNRETRDGLKSSKFENNIIDANTREMLRPYRARILA